jgi:hypothetical protein
MNDVANRLGRLREKAQDWLGRAANAAPTALIWLGAAIAIAVGLAIAWVVILILGRASEEIAAALTSGAPMLGRALGYLFMAALLAGGVALFLVAIAAVVRAAAWALGAVTALTSSKTSPQAERYVVAGLLALLPAAGIYFIATQGAFQALPVELKQYLIPVLLPFAIGAAAAPTWGRSQALTLTVFALIAVAGVVAATGHLAPVTAVPDPYVTGPMAAVWHWRELMQQSTAMQRMWWMLLVLLAVLIWAVAVFAGFRQGVLGERERPSVRFGGVSPPAGSAA